MLQTINLLWQAFIKGVKNTVGQKGFENMATGF